MVHARSIFIMGRAIAVALTCIIAGCATPKLDREIVFFPIPPDPPRLQHLTTISSSLDFEAKPSAFFRFISGIRPEAKPILKPYGVALSRNKMYICDTVLGSLEIFDFSTRKMTYSKSSGGGKLSVPINVTVDKADGSIYVADTDRGLVVIYSSDGNYAGTLGRNKEFKPSDVGITDDRVYVTAIKERVVRVYEKETRKRLFDIPKDPKNAEEDLFGPTNLAIGPDGSIFVSDTMAFRIQKYSPDGEYLQTFGRHGDSPGEFARPKGIAVDRDGNLYSVDAAAQVVQIMDPEGKLLLHFGAPGMGPVAFDLPAKVIIDYDHIDQFREFIDPGFEVEYLVIVTSQYGRRKVCVFGYGHAVAETPESPPDESSP